MSNETVKKVMAEKRRMTIGQLTDLLVSGALRRELGMDKTEFATLVSVMRSTIRRIEGLEATPRMGLIFNTAAVLRIGIDFPIKEERAKKMTNNQLTDKRSQLRTAAQNYQIALAWYQSNIDSPAALQAWDAATSEFMAAIGNRETDIIADLLDEIDELQERHKADIAPAGYFAFDNDGGFTNHDTAESARKEAQEAIDYFRGDACDGWPDGVNSVCWGVIMQQSTKTGERPVEEDDKCSSHIERVCDYVLLPELQEKPE